MHFLDLPPEILQQVLLYCTTPSFFHIIRTCKRVWKLAGSCRTVLLFHLDRVPGITLGLKDPQISTHSLFLTLRRRGATHLIGSNINGDCTEFSTGYGTVDANASSLSDGMLILALKESLRVRVYDIENASCRLDSIWGSVPPHGIGKILKVVKNHTTFSILYSFVPGSDKDSTQQPEQYQSCCKPIDQANDPRSSAMVDTGFDSFALTDTHYVFSQGDLLHSGEDISLQIPAPAPWLGRVLVPIDIAISSRLRCAVLWDLPGSVEPTIFAQVITYSIPKMSLDPTESYFAERIWPVGDRPHEEVAPGLWNKRLSKKSPTLGRHAILPELQPLPRRTADTLRNRRYSIPRAISFAQYDRRIKMFAPGGIIPYNILKAASRRLSEDEITEDPFEVPNTPWTRQLHGLRWILTTPFYSHHVTQLARNTQAVEEGQDINDEQRCSTSYLSLAATTLPCKHPLNLGSQKRRERVETEILCIIQAITTTVPDECTHSPDMTRCVSFDAGRVRVIARLWGWQPSWSTLAGEHNLACRDNRIAIADWDRILVWSLDSRALIDEADDPVPQSGMGDNDNDTGSETGTDISGDTPVPGEMRREPTWTYTKIYDAIMEAWYVELKPILLSVGTSVVVRQLMWKDANTLLVRTDRGLQMWNLGPQASGKRWHEVLEMHSSEPSDVNGGELSISNY